MFKKLVSRKPQFGGSPEIQTIKPEYKESKHSEWTEWLQAVKRFYRPVPHTVPRTVNAAPIFVRRLPDRRPYITVKIHSLEFTALLDSGCEISVVGGQGVKFLETHKMAILPSSLEKVSLADGSSKKVIGSVDLPIVADNVCHVINALIAPSLKHAFILGNDFIERFKLQLNFEDHTWRASAAAAADAYLSEINDDYVSPSLCSIETLCPDQRDIAEEIVDSFKEISSTDRLGRTDKIQLSLNTGEAVPFKKRSYPMSPYMTKIMYDEIDEMLRLGVIEPSNSPWCSPVLLVKKKNNEYRLCYDGRALNEVTRPDSYPLPNIDRILSLLRGAKYISSIDLRKAFWQIPLDPASREKTAFSVVGKGLFQFTVVPFGLSNSAQTQQRLVDALFGPEYEPNIFCYIDDIIVCSFTFDDHIRLLSEVKQKLLEANLTINVDKCEFFKTQLKFLGYIVGDNSLRTDPDKIAAMIDYPRPTNFTEVKRFIGLCSWYRRFIENFSSLVSPINDLLKGKKKKQSIEWNPEAEKSFILIKEALVSAPVLSQPDFTKPFVVQCDASNTGVGGVLTQNIDGGEKVVAYASRSLSRSERNYSVTERECLAVIFSIEKFRPYIEGVKFTVITDHHSLLWLNNLKNPTGKLARWAIRLRQHNFELIHRKGSSHHVPDALSRMYSNDPVSEDTVPTVTDPQISVLEVDTDRIDPWFDDFRSKILASPNDYPQWKVEKDLVFKHLPSSLPFSTNSTEWKILVPKPQRRDVMKSCHEPPVCAHMGFYKTFSRIQEKYYWPKMRQDILKYVRSCSVCGSQKSPNTMSMGKMGKEKQAQYPFQFIALDLIGPMVKSKRGYTWLLVVADWFSKFTLLHPLRKATAKNIATYLEDEVFLMFGVPQFVICDNGTNLNNPVLKDLCKQYGVQKIWFNAVYSPQCNFVERNNKTVSTAIRSYIKDDHRDWDLHLPKIRQAINTAKHEVTKFTPVFLNFGRHVPLSGNYYSSGNIENADVEIIPGDRNSYAAEVRGLTRIFAKVRDNLHKGYERNANAYNLRKRQAEFNIGDKVFRKNKVLSDSSKKFMAKLAPKFVAATVRRKLSPLVYNLVDENSKDIGNWHIKDLKPRYDYEDDVSVISSPEE